MESNRRRNRMNGKERGRDGDMENKIESKNRK